MTVAELIERLQLFDPRCEVELPNGELDDVVRAGRDRTVVRLVHLEPHQIASMRERQSTELKRLKAAALERSKKTVLPWEEQ
jgi:hypothetical protein